MMADSRNSPAPPGPLLSPGASFGPRYRIIKLLGSGGMGAVYQAWDQELGVAVAVKIIRPEVTADPEAARQMERRFKRELVLARQVTHKNVVRIHDLGEVDGIKYITMPYIRGEDLAANLARTGALPVPRALKTARQIASGLLAAHEAGVVHRDLKPANIMLDAEDNALIMDFGIALSAEPAEPDQPRAAEPSASALEESMTMAEIGEAATVGGTVIGTAAGKTFTTGGGTILSTRKGGIVGTLEYMAPEQARGLAVDHRADIYAFGLIFTDMLLGPRNRAQGVTPLQDFVERIGRPPATLREKKPDIPEALDALVVRCLQLDPAERLQATGELVEALDRLDAEGNPIPEPEVRRFTPKMVAAAVALAVGLMAGTWYFASRPAPPERAPLPVLIANFDNRAKDPLFEGTLEQALGIGIEGASFITAYPRRDALRVAAEINAGSSLDESVARLVAVREGIKVVLSGSIEPRGARYAVTVKAEQPDGTMISTASATASNKNDVLRVVGLLASRMRRALGDTAPPKPGEIETFTTVSLEAAHAYALGQENQAKPAEAIRYYLQAVELDPTLGRAYAGLATAHVNQKKLAEAGEYYKKALTLVDRLSEREKYRTLGTYYLTFAGNYDQAIETLRQLVVLYPADGAGWNNLATAYSRVGNMAESAAASRRAVELSPGNLLRRYNYAVNSMLAGDFTTAVTEANRILQRNAGFVYAYLPLALSTLFRGDLEKAAEIYERLEKVGSQGASLSRMGQADLKMYAGRYQDALAILLAGIAADEKEGSGERAYKLVALAETYLALGRKADAATAAAKAVQANDLDDGVRFLASRALVEAGEDAKAVKLATELEARLQKQTKSQALMIAGDIALKRNRLAEAVDAYREAEKQHDSWISHVLLGKAYVAAGHFPEALTELEAGEKRAGEAADLFGANTTTLHYLPPLHYWLGRAQEGIGTSDAARKSYQRFIAIREHGDPPDQLLADAKSRAGQ